MNLADIKYGGVKDLILIRLAGVGVLMVRHLTHLTLNLALGNSCELTFVESEFVYAQFLWILLMDIFIMQVIQRNIVPIIL